jgi:DNA helicase-2/ATP-dependent DNA helicase PcrA
MVDAAIDTVSELAARWETTTIGDILRFSSEKQIVRPSERLQGSLFRAPRAEVYDAEQHGLEKGDWLADSLFEMTTDEVAAYTSFIGKNTAFSTQHGVKGEEYSKVLVVYDDVEAGWHNYSFGKLLTPGILGPGTDKQEARGRKLAYVSFSRALEDLRVLLFTTDPDAARAELIAKGLLTGDQIELVI